MMLLLALLALVFGRRRTYTEQKGFGRCRRKTGMMRTVGQCKKALRKMGKRVRRVKKVNAWSKVCGCSYNPRTRVMQFNKFMHKDYCYKTRRWIKSGHNPRHMMAQNTDSFKNNLRAVCRKKSRRRPRRMSWARYYMLGKGKGRCRGPKKYIRPRPYRVKQKQASNYGSIWSAAECRFAIRRMGKRVKRVIRVNKWAKVCGCAYNPRTKVAQYNRFIHPFYCWKSRAHMKHQNIDSKRNNFRPVCRPSALTWRGL